MVWNPQQPIRKLPKTIRKYFMFEARILLAELKTNYLKVVLTPAPRPNFCGHKIRSAENFNPFWYRELYHCYHHFRRDRTFNALERIVTLKDEPEMESNSPAVPLYYTYDTIYRQLIKDRLTEGYKFYGKEVRPLEKVYLFSSARSNVPCELNFCLHKVKLPALLKTHFAFHQVVYARAGRTGRPPKAKQIRKSYFFF